MRKSTRNCITQDVAHLTVKMSTSKLFGMIQYIDCAYNLRPKLRPVYTKLINLNGCQIQRTCRNSKPMHRSFAQRRQCFDLCHHLGGLNNVHAHRIVFAISSTVIVEVLLKFIYPVVSLSNLMPLNVNEVVLL